MYYIGLLLGWLDEERMLIKRMIFYVFLFMIALAVVFPILRQILVVWSGFDGTIMILMGLLFFLVGAILAWILGGIEGDIITVGGGILRIEILRDAWRAIVLLFWAILALSLIHALVPVENWWSGYLVLVVVFLMYLLARMARVVIFPSATLLLIASVIVVLGMFFPGIRRQIWFETGSTLQAADAVDNNHFGRITQPVMLKYYQANQWVTGSTRIARGTKVMFPLDENGHRQIAHIGAEELTKVILPDYYGLSPAEKTKAPASTKNEFFKLNHTGYVESQYVKTLWWYDLSESWKERVPKIWPAPAPRPAPLPPAYAKCSNQAVGMAVEAAQRYGVPVNLMVAICKQESGCNLGVPDGSSGEIGPMQIMPSTGARYGASASDLRNPATNFDVGARHLRFLLSRYSENRLDLVALAYNAGEDKADRYIGIPENQIPEAPPLVGVNRYGVAYNAHRYMRMVVNRLNDPIDCTPGGLPIQSAPRIYQARLDCVAPSEESPLSQTPEVLIYIANHHPRRLDIYWINFEGQPVRMTHVDPQMLREIRTPINHNWLVKDSVTGEVVKTIIHPQIGGQIDV